jgi:hypothetical protein
MLLWLRFQLYIAGSQFPDRWGGNGIRPDDAAVCVPCTKRLKI